MSDEKAFILQFIADNQDVRYLDIVGQPYFNGRKTLVKPLVNNLLDQKLLSVKGVAINFAKNSLSPSVLKLLAKQLLAFPVLVNLV